MVSRRTGDDHGDRFDAGGAISGHRNARSGSQPAEVVAVGGEENPGGSLPPFRAVEIAMGMPGPA